ncbi:hypothetical protein EZV62_005873 [Acer yangbiense]|uniref:C2H2-type domain-containing protein n=1 Tax=Acer yangbiense TaxID=1000413 RepID=A0A5C7IPA0_9ROSI|nr:hypothetical protein EZV62_005873 [Acer yangbiense]
MPVAKLKAPNTTEVVKAEEGNESLDTFIKQAIGKEPLLSLSRNGDSPVQWIQLLQALDQHELPGWPLLTPLKVQMQKCDKCSREFCSTINHRRHIRVQHRLKKLDKDSTKNRDLLGAFWDKLSVDEKKEIISFKDVTLEEVPGSSIIKSLTTVIRKPGLSSLPQVCLRAGSALLDIFQARPSSSRFPISSQELFSILDDASEKTFLCGPAVSIQKYIFDGEAGKIGLETRNLVACTSFLVEQILVNAWLADKDAEALRCQKLLVEEEEADQRRQAELLERKRQKKLRQKAKEQRHEEKADDKESSDDTLESLPPPELSSPLAASDSDAQNADEMPDHFTSSLEPFRHANSEEYVDYEVQTGFGNGYTELGTGQNAERRMVQGNGRRHMIVARRQVLPQKSRGMPNGFHPNQNSQALKLGGGMQKHGINRDSRTAPIVNGNKVWSRKPKPENDSRISQIRVLQEDVSQPEQTKNREVLIGSISVTLGNCNHQEDKSPAEAPYDCQVEHPVAKKVNAPEKEKLKPDSMQSGANRSTVKFWRPVSRHGIKGPAGPVQNGSRESEADVITGQAGDQTLSNESCLRSSSMNDEPGNNSSLMENSSRPGSLHFNIHAAKAFLSERWKEAIASEHVKLVLPPESESPRHPEVQTDYHVTVLQSSDFQKRNVFGNAENRLVNNGGGALESSTGGGAVKVKFRTKPDKGAKIKYIPKQRIPTSNE